MSNDWRLEAVKKLMETMRLNFQKDGSLFPVAFLFAHKHPETGAPLNPKVPVVVGLKFENQLEKEELSDRLRDLCWDSATEAVAMGVETWVWQGTTKSEGILVTLETNLSHTSWFAAITRNLDGVPTLGEFLDFECDTVSGLFNNLLDTDAGDYDA